MWKSVTGERSSGPRATPAPASELSSLGLYSQDSPLLGLLSAVSRPAVSFLQRWSPYLPGRSLKRDFGQQESSFLQQLDDVVPPQQLHSLPWFNLSELGIQTVHENGKDSSLQAEAVMSQVLLHPPRCASKTWLGGLWSSSEDERLKSVGGGGALLTTAFIHTRLEETLAPGLTPLSPTLVHSLTPDLDNGYSSLEEEQLLAAKAQLQNAAVKDEDEDEEEEDAEEEEVPALKCDNKAIAFIMGCPCSDDSDGSGSDSSEDQDDDGFDSDCSSELSDSEEEEEEFDAEAERLWSALCQNHDPYNPRNFTARLISAPQPIPQAEAGTATAASSVSSSVSSASSVSSTSSVSSASSSSWDEASETEGEVDNLKLLGAFCSSDPYSPLNFQASIRTRPSPETKPGPETKPERARTVSESSHCSNRSGTKKKQVRFLAEAQVFWVGCEERCGPWEEFARDRARFAKRCSEMEQVLSSCLQPEHRRRAYLRISQSERTEERTHQSERTEEEEESDASQLVLTVFAGVCSYYGPTEDMNSQSEAELKRGEE